MLRQFGAAMADFNHTQTDAHSFEPGVLNIYGAA